MTSLRHCSADAAGRRAAAFQPHDARLLHEGQKGCLRGDSGLLQGRRVPRKRYGRSSKDTPGTCPRRCSSRRIAPSSAPFSGARRMPCRCSSPVPARNSSISFNGDGLYTSRWVGAIFGGGPGSGAASARKAAACASSKWARATAGLAAHVLPLLEPGLHSYTLLTSRPASSKRAAKARRLPRGGVQDIRPRKARHRTGTGGRVLRFHHRHECQFMRCATFVSPSATCAIFSPRAAASSSWTRPLPCSGRTPSSELTSGLVKLTDRDLRPHQPLLERAQWERVLRKWASPTLLRLIGRRRRGRWRCSP